MTPLQLLKNHYEGKTIVGGHLHPEWIGWKIVCVFIEDYEPMMGFILEKDGKRGDVNVLFEWNVEVA